MHIIYKTGDPGEGFYVDDDAGINKPLVFPGQAVYPHTRGEHDFSSSSLAACRFKATYAVVQSVCTPDLQAAIFKATYAVVQPAPKSGCHFRCFKATYAVVQGVCFFIYLDSQCFVLLRHRSKKVIILRGGLHSRVRIVLSSPQFYLLGETKLQPGHKKPGWGQAFPRGKKQKSRSCPAFIASPCLMHMQKVGKWYLFSALDVARGLALPGPTCPKNESF